MKPTGPNTEAMVDNIPQRVEALFLAAIILCVTLKQSGVIFDHSPSALFMSVFVLSSLVFGPSHPMVTATVTSL